MTPEDLNFLNEQEKQRLAYNYSQEDIESILSSLPDKRHYEFIFHKYYSKNTELTFDKFQDWTTWSYPIEDLIRFKQVILDNQEFITGKKIVDLACFTGYYSLFCLHLGASFVTATDVRQDSVALANELLTSANYTNSSTRCVDLHSYNDVIDVCSNQDTVLLTGVLYHIHDHIQVLESITKTQPTTIIIDTVIPKRILNINDPLISWRVETTDESIMGYYNHQSSVIVGAPNSAWLDLTMSFFSYKKIKQSMYKKHSNNTCQVTHVFQLVPSP